MIDYEVVVATLFEPPTLAGIVASCERQGVPCHVIKGQFTNHAWNAGLSKATSRYVAILNDDLVIVPDDAWVARLIAHHEAGAAWVAPRVSGKPLLHSNGRPMHFGHAFSIDRGVAGRTLIPDSLRIYYGDSWLLSYYGRHGWSVVEDVEVLLGAAAGLPGFGGWTGHTHRAEAEAMFGMTYEDVAGSDAAAWKAIREAAAA